MQQSLATPTLRPALAAPKPTRPRTLKITRHTEVIVDLADQEADEIHPILLAINAHGVRMLAHSLCANRRGSALLFVADDSPKACFALQHAGWEYRIDSVVFVETDRRPALVAQLGAQLLRHGVGVLYSYMSWTEGENLFAVFKTTDDERALRALAA